MPCVNCCNFSLDSLDTPAPGTHSVSTNAVFTTAALVALAASLTFVCFYYGMTPLHSVGVKATLGYLGGTFAMASLFGLYNTLFLIFKPQGPKDDGIVPYVTAIAVFGAPFLPFYFLVEAMERCGRKLSSTG